MESILDLGIKIVLFFQGLGAWLAGAMKLLSFLGQEEFYLLLAPALYWCIDSHAGLRVGLILMISGCTNTVFKLIFHQPRPYWIDPAVKAYGAETSFGIPSGHAQNSIAVWGGLAASLKKKGWWILAGILAFLIGLSRVYLGVHFPTDVLLGWVMGAVLLWLYLKLESRVSAWIKQLRPGVQVGVALTISLAFIALGIIASMSLRSWMLPAEWIANASAATPDAEPINPTDLSGLVSNGAAFFGLCLGAIMMAQRGGFDVKGKAWQLVLRYLIGVAGVLILWAGLRAVFPSGEDMLSYILRYIRYAAVGFWVTGGATWLFYRLKLAQKP